MGHFIFFWMLGGKDEMDHELQFIMDMLEFFIVIFQKR